MASKQTLKQVCNVEEKGRSLEERKQVRKSNSPRPNMKRFQHLPLILIELRPSLLIVLGQPSLRNERFCVLEVALAVISSALVDSYACILWDHAAADYLLLVGVAWEDGGSGWVDAESFGETGDGVGEEGVDRVDGDVVFGGEGGADLFGEFLVGVRCLEEVVC